MDMIRENLANAWNFRTACTFLLVLALSLGLETHWAFAGSWQPVGPWGGWVDALATSPASSSVVFAVSKGRLFKSVNGGDEWTEVTGVKDVSSVSLDPTNPDIVYVGTAVGMLKSTDGGETWTEINNGRVSSGPSPDPAIVIAIDPSNPSTIYEGSAFCALGCGGTFFKSSDAGATWTNVIFEEGHTHGVWSIAISQDGTTVLAGTTHGLFKSEDNGETWSLVEIPGIDANSTNIRAVALRPGSPGTFFVAVNGGLFITEDGGSSWTDLTGRLNGESVTNVVSGPDESGLLFAKTDSGLYKSADWGQHWNKVEELNNNPCLPMVTCLEITSISGTRVIFAGTDMGVFKSTDDGATWTFKGKEMNNMSISDIIPLGQTIYALTSEFGFTFPRLYKTVDGGSSWQCMKAFSAESFGSGYMTGGVDILAPPDDPDTLYAGITAVPAPLLGGNMTGAVLKSTDGGVSWSQVLSDQAVYSLALDQDEPLYVYACTQNGVFASSDGGANWTLHTSGLDLQNPPQKVFVDILDPSTLYAPGFLGLYKSVNRGVTWTYEDMTGLPDNFSMLVLAMAPDGQTFYAGLDSAGGYKSTDSGKTWTAMNNGIEDADTVALNGLVIDPKDPSTLYASTHGKCLGMFCETQSHGNVYKSVDGGANWQVMNDGLSGTEINCLVADPSGLSLFAGTEGMGIYEYRTLVMGDTSGDGQIDIRDALFIARAAVGLPVNTFNEEAADVNCSGKVDIVDALLVARKVVGLPVNSWCGP